MPSDKSTSSNDETAADTSGDGQQSQGPKWLVVVALVPFFASFFFATKPHTAPPLTITRELPGLQFATYQIHHGEKPVELSAELMTIFPFRNSGDAPITIGEIERSCGCMAPQLSKKTLQPGEEGDLYVPIATANQTPGFHEYVLTVNYTDPEPQRVSLTIKAVFPEKMVVVQPKALFLSQASEKPIDYPDGIAISDFRPHPLKVRKVESSSSFLTVATSEESFSIDEGSATTFDVSVAGSFPPGRHRLLVAATTDDDEFPVLTVPVWVDGPKRPADQSIRIKPDRMSLAAQPSAAADASEVIVGLPAEWKISHVESWPPELEVTYEKTPTGNPSEQVITVKAELSELPERGLTEGSISILADESNQMVTIPVQIKWP